MAVEAPSILLAIAAGFVSFASPCCLPLVPGYLATISGPADVGRASTLTMLGRSLLFVTTFSTIFILFGLGATAAGAFLFDNQTTLNTVSGALIIAMGVLLLASLVVPRLNLAWHSEGLMESAGRGGPVVAGAAFAIAWTPCVGPTLSAILSLAATSQGTARGGALLAFYAIGLGIPFVIAALAYARASNGFSWLRRHPVAPQVFSGITLIVMGILVVSGQLFRLNIQAQSFLESVGANFFNSV